MRLAGDVENFLVEVVHDTTGPWHMLDTPALRSGKDKDKDNCTDDGCLLGYM